jgi:hypothetical protein
MLQISQMINEIKKTENAGALNATLMQIYVYIDALSFWGRPVDQEKTTRKDFIEWVDKYLKADSGQSYQYEGKDVYGARCALLHSFSSEADYHTKNIDTKMFGYHDGGQHGYNEAIHKTLVMIGIPSFVDDFIYAIGEFLKDIKKRISIPDEKRVLEERLSKVLAVIPFRDES